MRESIVGNGDLSTVFDLSSITTHFNSIRTAKNEIQEHKNTFNSLATNYNAYNTIKSNLEKKIDFTEDTNFIDSSTTPTEISLNNIIDLLNTKIGSTSDEKYKQGIKISFALKIIQEVLLQVLLHLIIIYFIHGFANQYIENGLRI